MKRINNTAMCHRVLRLREYSCLLKVKFILGQNALADEQRKLSKWPQGSGPRQRQEASHPYRRAAGPRYPPAPGTGPQPPQPQPW